jgi:hypothetical protein
LIWNAKAGPWRFGREDGMLQKRVYKNIASRTREIVSSVLKGDFRIDSPDLRGSILHLARSLTNNLVTLIYSK